MVLDRNAEQTNECYGALKLPHVRIANELSRNGKVSPAAKAVYLYLLTFKRAYPPYSAIMRATGIKDKRTITKALNELKRYKVISWVRGYRNNCNLYFLHFPTVWELPVLTADELWSEDEE